MNLSQNFIEKLLARMAGSATQQFRPFYGAGDQVHVEKDSQYIRVWLRAAHIVNTRKWARKFYPTVHAHCSYNERTAGQVQMTSVVAPGKTFEALDPAHLDRLTVLDKLLLGPIPYRGDLSMEVALFSVEAVDLAKPYLDLLADLTDSAGLAFLGPAKAFVDPIRRGAALLFQDSSKSELEIGLARTYTLLRTGNFVIARLPADAPQPVLHPTDFTLRDGSGNLVNDIPYLVLGIEALSERDDYASIPAVRTGWQAVLDAANSGSDPAEVRKRFEDCRRTVWLSADLVRTDKQRIVKLFLEELSDAGFDLAAPLEAAAMEAAGPAAAPRAMRAIEMVLAPLMDGGQPQETRNRGDDAAAADPGEHAPVMEEAVPGGNPPAPMMEAAALESTPPPWRLAKALLQLRAEVNARFPNRNKLSDGGIGDPSHQTRDSDHNPWVRDGGYGVVTAFDVTHDPASGCTGEWLAESIRSRRDPRIKYIIWNKRICNSQALGGAAAWAWRPYGGSNPHNKHVHISVRSESAAYDSTASWQLAAAEAQRATEAIDTLELATMSKPLPRATALEAMSEADAVVARMETPGDSGAPTEPSRSLRVLAVKGKSEPLQPAAVVHSALETIIGPVDGRVRILDTDLAPWRMICALRMRGANGAGAIGTGWFAGPRTIITAGHCVYSRQFFNGWASNIEAIPGRNGTERPFGALTSTRFSSVDRWVQSEDPDFDIGCIHLDQPPPIELGWFAIGALPAEELEDYLVNISGYPADRGSGTEQYHHRNRVLRVTGRRVFYDVDTYGAQSGAPVWIHENELAPPLVIGIHAYGIGGSPNGLRANSAPRIIPEVLQQIRDWVQADGGWPPAARG